MAMASSYRLRSMAFAKRLGPEEDIGNLSNRTRTDAPSSLVNPYETLSQAAAGYRRYAAVMP
jgi:hypothetical protein